MTDLLFVTETEEVTVFNYNYRYNKITTMYMNRLTIDIDDKTEIIGNFSLPYVFEQDKGDCWKQDIQHYSDKKGFRNSANKNVSQLIHFLTTAN